MYTLMQSVQMGRSNFPPPFLNAPLTLINGSAKHTKRTNNSVVDESVNKVRPTFGLKQIRTRYNNVKLSSKFHTTALIEHIYPYIQFNAN